jgi:GT2 family glycosyltransferase
VAITRNYRANSYYMTSINQQGRGLGMGSISSNDGALLPPQDQYDLVIIIANWNTKDLLVACLSSLPSATDGLSVRTVVVDNASTDGSVERVAEMFPDVEIIANHANLGFSRANNLALLRHRDSARYLLLLNPDTIVSPNAFRNMISFMDENPQVGIAGCKVMTPQGTLDWACKRKFLTPSLLFYKALGLDRRFPKSSRFGKYHLTYLDENQVHEVDSVVGAFMMIRKDCLKSVGLLDESYFMYGEDIDFCFRTKEKGWKIFYVPTATIIHYKGQSTRKRSYRMIFHWYSAIDRFYRKRMAARYSVSTNAVVWCGLYFMCGISLAANAFRDDKRVPSRRRN